MVLIIKAAKTKALARKQWEKNIQKKTLLKLKAHWKKNEIKNIVSSYYCASKAKICSITNAAAYHVPSACFSEKIRRNMDAVKQ